MPQRRTLNESRRLAFDMDGVLLDSGRCITTCIQKTLLELTGRSQAIIDDSFIGPPIRASATRLLDTSEPVLLDRFIDRYRELNNTLGASMTDIYPGIPTLLRSLCEHFELIIVTSKLETAAVALLQSKSLLDFFAGIHGSETDRAIEPKAETLARALKAHGKIAALVGDRSHDTEAAKVEGILSIGVTWGFGTREELEHCLTDYIVDSPQQLGDLVTSLLGE